MSEDLLYVAGSTCANGSQNRILECQRSQQPYDELLISTHGICCLPETARCCGCFDNVCCSFDVTIHELNAHQCQKASVDMFCQKLTFCMEPVLFICVLLSFSRNKCTLTDGGGEALRTCKRILFCFLHSV